MKPPPIRYERADSPEDALSMLAGDPEGAKVLAGGQSLIPLLNLRLARPDLLVDVAGIEALDYVRVDGELTIGALTTLAALERNPELDATQPLLAEAIPHVAHVAIRNRGTVGGTLAHADPAAELPVVLTALGGTVVARSSSGERRIDASEFFQGFLMTALEPEELLDCVILPVAGPGDSYAFEEFARRPGDFALASVASAASRDRGELRSLRVAIGGVAMTPQLLDGLDALTGAGGSEQDVTEACGRAAELARDQVDPRGDIHGSAEYRRHLVGVLVRRSVGRALGAD